MTTYRVVCIFPNGNIHSRPFGDFHEADLYLCECSQSGRFASGSIWNDSDEELSGFANDGPDRNLAFAVCDESAGSVLTGPAL